MAYSFPCENKHHVKAGETRDGQKHLVVMLQGGRLGQVVEPIQVIRRQAEDDDEHEADVLHLSPELLLSP